MKSKEVILKAKKLIGDNKLEKARELLLEEGFVSELDETVQKAFETLMPPGELLKDKMNGVLRLLKDPDRRLRYKSADSVRRDSLKEWSVHLKEWLADPRTTGSLIESLKDEDSKVAEAAAAALSGIIRGYFPDMRAFAPLINALKSSRKNMRLYAVLGIGSIRHKDRWEVLVTALKDSATEVRRAACMSVVQNLHGSRIDTSIKEKLRTQLQELMLDKDGATRRMAENAIRCLGEQHD